MKTIELTQGQYAIVDDVDFERLSQFKWRAFFDPKLNGYYALRSLKRDNGKRPMEWMSRIIANAKKGELVDHINHNTLDNRKDNLRIVTCSQNQYNKSKNKTGSSKFKGVYKHSCGKWMARIKVDKKTTYLGLFSNELNAAIAYDNASKKYHGEYGLRNL